MNKQEISALAAQMVVEEGLEYGPAKRRAVRQLGLPQRTPLPGNNEVEDAVREYLALYCAATQPTELLALRRLALRWMERLSEFRPHLSGAVWRGTATRLSDIYLQLFCDDEKSTEIALIDAGIHYKAQTVHGPRGAPAEALSIHDHCAELDLPVGVHLIIHDHDDLRGALLPDATKRPPLGDLTAVQAILRDVAPK